MWHYNRKKNINHSLQKWNGINQANETKRNVTKKKQITTTWNKNKKRNEFDALWWVTHIGTMQTLLIWNYSYLLLFTTIKDSERISLWFHSMGHGQQYAQLNCNFRINFLRHLGAIDIPFVEHLFLASYLKVCAVLLNLGSHYPFSIWTRIFFQLHMLNDHNLCTISCCSFRSRHGWRVVFFSSL